MQLTGTNRSIGLIALIFSVHRVAKILTRMNERRISSNKMSPTKDRLLRFLVLRRPGGFSEEPQPDPIPNSAVKLFSANGTMA